VPSFRNCDLPKETFAEYWCGKRRIFYAPISPTQVFMALMTAESDTEAARNPIDKRVWKESFPFLSHMIDRIENPIEWASFVEIKLKTWHAGRTVLIGDAAHAMAPNFGQGGATAMMDAISLAANLDGEGPMEEAITRWEERQRPVINGMQLASRLYGMVTYWPTFAQRGALWAMNRSTWVRKQRTIAFNYVPDGVAP
jgi:2-polyprenyl-6-methoxyphenol hydroxylase-like FAD-dependent oxidoreductase